MVLCVAELLLQWLLCLVLTRSDLRQVLGLSFLCLNWVPVKGPLLAEKEANLVLPVRRRQVGRFRREVEDLFLRCRVIFIPISANPWVSRGRGWELERG